MREFACTCSCVCVCVRARAPPHASHRVPPGAESGQADWPGINLCLKKERRKEDESERASEGKRGILSAARVGFVFVMRSVIWFDEEGGADKERKRECVCLQLSVLCACFFFPLFFARHATWITPFCDRVFVCVSVLIQAVCLCTFPVLLTSEHAFWLVSCSITVLIYMCLLAAGRESVLSICGQLNLPLWRATCPLPCVCVCVCCVTV